MSATIRLLDRRADRIALARRFGATDVVSERGNAAIERLRELAGGLGAHSVLECVGHGESMRTAAGIARAGGAVGRLGVPQETTIPDAQPTFYGNITIAGGPAPVRAYMHELMPRRAGRPHRTRARCSNASRTSTGSPTATAR